MATFAGALGRGLAGYAANRERSDARDAEEERQRRAEARQAERDKQADIMMALQTESIRAGMARNAADDVRRGEQDRNTAIDSGLRDTEPTRQMGTLMSGAANVGVGSTGAALGALGGYGRAAQAAAESPTQYSVGGKPMVKAAESLAERTARMAVEQRRGERMADNEFTMERDKLNATQQGERDTRQNTFQSGENAKNRAATMAGITARLTADANQPPAPRTLPMGVESEISSNLASISAIDDATAMLKAPGGKEAFGIKRGLQNMVGIANRADPENTGLRAIVSNIGSMQIKLRSGTAVSATEWPRIRGFIPTVYDSPKEVEDKLKEIRRAISEETSARASYYQQQGYAVPGTAPRAPDVRNDRALPPPGPNMNDPEFRKFLQEQGVIR